MAKLIPIVLELDDELADGEDFAGIKTIALSEEFGNVRSGYVAIIKNYKNTQFLRLGNLKAVPWDKKDFGKFVV